MTPCPGSPVDDRRPGRRPRAWSWCARLATALAIAGAGACIDRREQLPVWTCDDDPAPPTWSLVSAAVMRPSCGTGSCHSRLAQRAGVVLDTAEDGYRALLAAEPEPFVRPGAPDDSRLMYLLVGVEVARTMPPDAPLPAVDVALVERWICAGAEDD